MGDLFPMAAIARELLAHGHQVICACSQGHVDTYASLGLETVVLNDSSSSKDSWMYESLGMLKGIERDIGNEVAELLPLAQDVDLVLGNQVAFSAALVAEELGKRWIYCVISPLTIYSKYEPSIYPVLYLLPDFIRRMHNFDRLFLWFLRKVGSFIGRNITKQRHLMGLPYRGNPLFEGKYSDDLNLFLCSTTLVTPQPDWPNNLVQTGNCWFEYESEQSSAELDALQRFSAKGSPPVIIVPGSDIRRNAGKYYDICIEACRSLGLRAVIVANARSRARIPSSEDIFIAGYLPYSQLFPFGLVVIHSGGIGTLSWCLRYGKYSIISPSVYDQLDNASRALRKGYATVIRRSQFNSITLRCAIEEFQQNKEWHQNGEQLKHTLELENGALIARQQIEALLHDD